MDFRSRLREEIEYSGMLYKEVAAKAGITKRTMDSYVGSQGSIPSADIAVRLAKVLGVSVEYLVTGERTESSVSKREQHILSCIREIPEYERNALVLYIETLSKKSSK